MGTDIHLAVEVRQSDGTWRCVTQFREDDGYLTNYPNGYYESRNYDLFAILANVRNGSGFAGVDTGDGFIPIHDLRGIPDDATSDVRRWAEDGDHSHNWCTVQELIEYDWTRITKKRGFVTSKQFALFKARGYPEDWWGGIGGTGVKLVTTDAMELLCLGEKYEAETSWWHIYHNTDEKRTIAGTYTKIAWERPYYACAKEFLGETMPKLWRLGAPTDVRIIYWFDS